MNYIKIKNTEVINISDIPTLEISNFRAEIIKLNKRPIGFFGKKENENTKLYAVLADDTEGEIYITSTTFSQNDKSYNSITQDISAYHIFEREFYEEFNIEPLNHPWLKPVRKQDKEYKFFEMEGEEIHQVAVGPIHAGIIEPGHFRFMCNGEKVYNLEIQLGYQHKGIENLFLKGKQFNNQLAESICGDSVIAHNLAYTNAIEALCKTKISKRAELIRLIALELERVAIHIGDMGAIAGDIAYLMGNSVFGATRTLVINTLLDICGSRFGRGLIKIGGVNFDIDNEKSSKIKSTLEKVEKDVERMVETMFQSASVMSRLERTGYLSKEKAIALNIVGMAARASGIDIDSRFDFKNTWYQNKKNSKQFEPTGDVYSRFFVRYKETIESISYIKDFLNELEKYNQEYILTEITDKMQANSLVVSITEGWRGEVVHIAITDEQSNISKYKIKDASFNNWYGLAMAVQNNDISDFPLCNKSFNLSYCGNDL